MPKWCVVQGCETGRRTVKVKCSRFQVPSKIEQFNKWKNAIPGLKSELKTSQYVCEKHFKDSDIHRKRTITDANGQVIAETTYAYPRLDPLAVPSIFQCQGPQPCPIAATVEFTGKDQHWPKSHDLVDEINDSSTTASSTANTVEIDNQSASSELLSKDHDWSVMVTVDDSSSISPPIVDSALATALVENPNTVCATPLVEGDGFTMESSNDARASRIESSSNQEIPDCPERGSTFPVQERALSVSSVIISDNTGTGSTTCSEKLNITIPKPWAVTELTSAVGQTIVFSYVARKTGNGKNLPVTEKSVTLNPDRTLEYCVYGRAVDVQGTKLTVILDETSVLPPALQRFKNMNLCSGLGSIDVDHLSFDTAFKDYVDQWRHKNCTMISKKKRCDDCMKMRLSVQKRAVRNKKNKTLTHIYRASNPIDQRKLTALRKKSIRERRGKRAAWRRIKILKEMLEKQAQEIASITDETFHVRCAGKNVSEAQKLALKEIISAAGKKSANGRRYSEEWLMLCMLLNLRSPSNYELLRKNNILPLPCTRTIRGYFSLLDIKCGFDEDFAKILKKHFSNKTALQRHGVILLDEINLRKSVAVCSKSLTYVGLTDHGADGPQSTNIEDQATHGLVMMFQPLADSYTQPFAVFASKNPVKGEELWRFVIKAIMYLEKCGALIHGVIADGASTNAKMWSLLGVTGTPENTQTWFAHPDDDNRKVFVFSDPPHVIKNIRNRLYNKKRLRIKSSNDYIRWEYIEKLFDLDSKHAGNARACPKLTQRHVVLDNTSKMRVRLATQIFSNSVAQGLTFYSSHPGTNLQGCDETIRFCKRMNDVFDAMNRKTPNQGLTPHTKDFKVIQDTLQWLNEWEAAAKKGDITKDEYLTPETSKGLRISLQSTMDMCTYLIENYDFQYVLTGKVNQDNLEKFFGTIRQAAGSNEHPNGPTFLQLYKILTVYSILKPPKYGNCTVSEQPSPMLLISLRELKAAYGEKCEAKCAKYRRDIKEKLDKIIQYEDWEADEVIEYNTDHDYPLSPILDCIIYYVTGYLCKQVLKSYHSCDICQQAIRSDSSTTSSVSQLVDLKSRGGLIHANLRFFNLIRYIENCFAKNASQNDVFDCTLDEVLSSYQFSFPCKNHASDILSFAIVYYIRLRMRQNAYQENLKLKKKFVTQRKISKLTNQ